jgi:hypothetical protein
VNSPVDSASFVLFLAFKWLEAATKLRPDQAEEAQQAALLLLPPPDSLAAFGGINDASHISCPLYIVYYRFW